MNAEQVAPYMSEDAQREIVRSSLQRDRQMVHSTRVNGRRKVAILAACFFFIAATSIGIQLQNRKEASGRTETLEQIQRVQQQSQLTLQKIEEVTGIICSITDDPRTRLILECVAAGDEQQVIAERLGLDKSRVTQILAGLRSSERVRRLRQDLTQ